MSDDSATTRVQRSSAHGLRDLVRQTGDVKIGTNLGVPRSTGAGCLRRGESTIVTAELLSIRENQFQAEVVRLSRQIQGF